MTDKRYDIQGLRAWAVIAVVTFHFFPSLLPLGYLGVDVFFVLSGFLISLVLENKQVVISTYINFYFKRTRRIFPLLLLIVLFSSIYSFLYYGNTLFLYSEKSALHAALFITNLKGRNEGEDYFRDIEKVDDFYTHTWSLSVEIQFYLIAPLILHALKPSCSDSSFSTAYFLFIAGFSYIFSKAINPSAAFYSPIARLWQFLAGAIAFQLQNVDYLPLAKEPETPSTIYSPMLSRFDIVMPSILSLCVLACDIAFNHLESACRDAVTIGAALLLVLKLTSPILTHRILQIIGDSSYALYLIHWPVVCVLKYHECDRWTDRLLAMIICFAVSVLVYNFYETWYLTLSEKGTFILIGLLYLSCASVYFFYHKIDKEEMVMGTTVKALSFGEARLINLQMDMQWENNLKLANCTFRDPKVDRNPWGFCNLPEGNGTLSFLIIGNSYAANHGKMVVEHLKDHYGRIAVHTVSECEPLIVTTSPYCSGAVKTQEAFLKDIDTYKPDVLFLSSRYIEPNVPLGTIDVKNDQLYIDMMNKLKKYEAKVKKVFILQTFPRPANLQKIEDIRIANNQTIEGYMEEAIEADSIPMRKRVEELAKNCEKCVIYDLMQLHMDKGRFMVANPVSHLHYFEALRHHTPIEMKLLFLLSFFFILGVTHADLGFDADQNIRSSPFDLQSISTSTFECTKNNGYDFFIGRIYKANGEIDYKGVQNIRNAIAAGLNTVDAYIIPCMISSCPSADKQVSLAINATKGTQFGTLWLDLEELFIGWPADKSFNRQFILDMINTASKMGQSAGIFTESNSWKSIVGDWNGASHVPLWWLSYSVESNFNGFISFGGWDKPKVRQVNANLKGPCNVGVIAVNYYE